ncbi:transcriptional repressor [candidate division TA06 bacterium]|nr:transcriptional repressor [candidate division TA06 bacterium]
MAKKEIQSESDVTLLSEALAVKGQRLTEQRLGVYQYLMSVNTHPTAEEVYFAIKDRISKVSLATVYNALETLVSCGLTAKLTFSGGISARYDWRTEPHSHTRCIRCGQIQDLKRMAAPKLLEKINLDGFRVVGCNMELLGYCPSCAKIG